MLDILHHKTTSTGSAALMIAIFGLISRIFGLIRDRLLAAQYGASIDLDIYYASFRIPDFIFNLIFVGALATVFIPVFCHLFEKEEKKAWDLSNSILTINLIFVLTFSILALIFTKKIIYLIAPGFDKNSINTTINLTRIMLLSPIFLSLSNLAGNILQIFGHFLSYSIAPIMYNIGIILGIIFLTKYFGIYGLGIGVVLGAIMHFIVQIIPATKSGFQFKLNLNLKTDGLKEIIKLIIPRSINLIAIQINFWIITALASILPSGSISVLNFANNLQYVPIAFLGISFAIAVFPELSKQIAKDEINQFTEKFLSVFKNVFFLSFPVSAFFYIFRAQIVRLVLGTGKFDWLDTRLTAAILGVFAFSIFAQCLIQLLVRVFYALKDTLTPLIINIILIILNIILSVYFIKLINGNEITTILGKILRIEDISNIKIIGLALATTITNILNFIILIIALKNKLQNIYDNNVIFSIIKTLISTLISALFAYFAIKLLGSISETKTFIGLFFETIIAGLIGIGIFIITNIILKSKELEITTKRTFSLLSSFTKK